MSQDTSISLLEEILIYGSLANFASLDSDPDIIPLLLKCIPMMQKVVDWEYRLLHNFHLCLIRMDHIKHAKVDLGSFYKALKDIKLEDVLLGDLLTAVYLGHLKKEELAMLTKDNDAATFMMVLYEASTSIVLRSYLQNVKSMCQNEEMKGRPIELHHQILFPAKKSKNTFTIVATNLRAFRAAVRCDSANHLTQLQLPPSDIDFLVKRVKLLLQNAPRYWTLVEHLYAPKLKKLNLDFDDFRLIYSLAPKVLTLPEGLNDKDINNLNTLTWKIWRMDALNRGYFLGFPIHLGVPGNKSVKEALYKLARDGPEKYAKEKTQAGSKLTKISYPGLTKYGSNDGKEIKDLLEVPFDSYGPFDRIAFIDGDFYYEFTRPSWPTILENKQNPYNKTSIFPIVYDQIATRYRMASLCKFPPATSLVELLKGIDVSKDTPTLKKTTEMKESKQTGSTSMSPVDVDSTTDRSLVRDHLISSVVRSVLTNAYFVDDDDDELPELDDEPRSGNRDYDGDQVSR